MSKIYPIALVGLERQKEETGVRRPEKLIKGSDAGRRMPQFARKNEPG